MGTALFQNLGNRNLPQSECIKKENKKEQTENKKQKQKIKHIQD